MPRPRAQRAFNQEQRMQGDAGKETKHGTACAEIVADMVPDAELYLAAINGEEGRIVAGAQWLAELGWPHY